MSEYMPQYAPIEVLAFLGTAALLVASLLVFLFGLFRRSRRILLGSAGSGAVILAGYCVILLGFSVFSRDVVLPMGSWKYFCEIDCHIANSVASVQRLASVGPEAQQITSSGQFVIVEVRTWFDPSSIGPRRGNGPLTPNARSVVLVDGAGRMYTESFRTGMVLSALGFQSTPLSSPLRPGEAFVSYFVFEVSSEVSGLQLRLGSADDVNALLWGHENSPLHKKIVFSLSPTASL